MVCWAKLCWSYYFNLKMGAVNPLNAELNPICHLLAILGVHSFLHVSRIRINVLEIFLFTNYLFSL
jgi:hypothetical protein